MKEERIRVNKHEFVITSIDEGHMVVFENERGTIGEGDEDGYILFFVIVMIAEPRVRFLQSSLVRIWI